MLRRLRIRNFRSLKDSGELEVRRLNLLVGPNSSGKTSLFKIFLALKETVEGQPVSAPLQPKGYFANIGNYREFVWNHNERNRVNFWFAQVAVCQPADALKELEQASDAADGR